MIASTPMGAKAGGTPINPTKTVITRNPAAQLAI